MDAECLPMVRSCSTSPTPTRPLRFAAGDRVICYTGTWEVGVVSSLLYVNSAFPVGWCAPYQLRLDDGSELYAPNDTDVCVRRLEGNEHLVGLTPAEVKEKEQREAEAGTQHAADERRRRRKRRRKRQTGCEARGQGAGRTARAGG